MHTSNSSLKQTLVCIHYMYFSIWMKIWTMMLHGLAQLILLHCGQRQRNGQDGQLLLAWHVLILVPFPLPNLRLTVIVAPSIVNSLAYWSTPTVVPHCWNRPRRSRWNRDVLPTFTSPSKTTLKLRFDGPSLASAPVAPLALSPAAAGACWGGAAILSRTHPHTSTTLRDLVHHARSATRILFFRSAGIDTARYNVTNLERPQRPLFRTPDRLRKAAASSIQFQQRQI